MNDNIPNTIISAILVSLRETKNIKKQFEDKLARFTELERLMTDPKALADFRKIRSKYFRELHSVLSPDFFVLHTCHIVL